MNNDEIKVLEYVKIEIKSQFEGESTGHDWFHIERVWRNAKLISEKENCNKFVVELSALLHDIADHKFVENSDEEALTRINSLLFQLDVDQKLIDEVVFIVQNCSFKGGVAKNAITSIEGLIVQDADRLDAIGAIGIARTFAYGGKFGNEIYNPEVSPQKFKSAKEYRDSRTHTVNHFYEKLLKLKEGMNTETGKLLAEERHNFMLKFLEQFYKEWEGAC